MDLIAQIAEGLPNGDVTWIQWAIGVLLTALTLLIGVFQGWLMFWLKSFAKSVADAQKRYDEKLDRVTTCISSLTTETALTKQSVQQSEWQGRAIDDLRAKQHKLELTVMAITQGQWTPAKDDA